MILGLPPISEQTDIINYLDEKNQKIDKIIYNIKSQKEMLKELHKTLINDVVTGKYK
ncbi:restriction endonuclease subunit S, partial [Vibrio cholerae]|nr:restriction endonuclease subunit S [Vibrio cholerae]